MDGSAGDMAGAERLDNELRLPFGLGLVVQFEVCPGERCRSSAMYRVPVCSRGHATEIRSASVMIP